MKILTSKRIALKVDVIGLENILFADASVQLSRQWKLYRLGTVPAGLIKGVTPVSGCEPVWPSGKALGW